MKFNTAETLRDPASTINAIVQFGMAHAASSFDDVVLSDEEKACIDDYNREAAVKFREEVRQILLAQFRAVGVRLADNWGVAAPEALHLLTAEPEGRA